VVVELQEPIQETDKRLWQLAREIGQMPEIPREVVEELAKVCLRLTGYVGELGYQKRKLDEAWAEFERQ